MTPEPMETDAERARAAVAVACLRWLGCTGPLGTIEVPRTDRPMPEIVPIRFLSPSPEPEPAHPLWDRWLDCSV